MKVPSREIRKALREDDGAPSRDNPIVPFRMSDRIVMDRLQWWLAALTVLIGWFVGGPMVAHAFPLP